MLAVKTSDMGEHGQACCRLIWAKAGLALSQDRPGGRGASLRQEQLPAPSCPVRAAGETACPPQAKSRAATDDSAEHALMQGIHHSLLQARGSKA